MIKGLFNKNNELPDTFIELKDIDLARVPKHVAVIMDGNGRWAKKNGLPRVAGHKAGIKTIKDVARIANRIGIRILTLYAFSTENWKRPESEVKFLMNLPIEFLKKEIGDLMANNIKVKMMGFMEQIPGHTLKAVQEAEKLTKDNTGLILNFALNYGSRYEMIQAMKSVINDVIDGNLQRENIDETTISNYLLTKDYPDPDLLIRTSGEQRISNFLLWQLAYSELWFTPVFWPEFNEQLFLKAIYDFQQRDRRFGGLNK